MEELREFVEGLSDDELKILQDYIHQKSYTIPRPSVRIEIPYKFPSLNEYVNECRRNKFAGSKMKRNVQDDIGWYVNTLPTFAKPITIHFHWVEGNRRRDFDNVMYARKFILDSMVELGKVKDDNPDYVTGFLDTFGYGDDWKVILEISEVD